MPTNTKLIRYTTWIVELLNRYIHWLNRENAQPTSEQFEDLAPTIISDENNIYTESLLWAVGNENVKNIGLTGPYGSGKSSILKTFIHAYPQLHFLSISLASFTESEVSEATERQLIELSIVQQIFYKERGKDIPDSRFKRIKSLRPMPLWRASFLMLSWLLTSTYVLFPSWIQKETHLNKALPKDSTLLFYTSLCVLLIGALIVIRYIIRTINKTRFEKLNLTSGAIEVSDQADTSILNKHLDEILYFFEVTRYQVVMIEDLDRFNDPEIFTKLREINLLLNSSKQINRKITFIYALRDELFVNANRTKFFDFLIPVIPIINFSNSADILTRKLQKSIDTKQISSDLISDISMYIQDMRMLKTIINEYLIYQQKIGETLNQNKLLALIIYKNIYPKDFADLHSNKGNLYDLFAAKSQMTSRRVTHLSEQIDALIAKEERISQLTLHNIWELRAVYIQKIAEKTSSQLQIQNISVSNESLPFRQLNTDENFEKLKESTRIQPNAYSSSFSFKDLEKEIDPSTTYKQREDLITANNNKSLNDLKKQVVQLTAEKNDLSTWTMAEILNTTPAPDLPASIQTEKIILYFLRNGYIDEMYPSYISYFYEGTITRNDILFVMNVKNRVSTPFDFKLDHVGQLIKKLNPKEFLQQESLNYAMVDYLLGNNKNTDEVANLFKQLADQSMSSLSFIDGYIVRGIELNQFLPRLADVWNSIWIWLVQKSNYPREKLDLYLKNVLRNCSVEQVLQLNVTEILTKYIDSCRAFLFLFPDRHLPPKIKEMLLRLNVSFEVIEYSEESTELFQFIYERSLYALNQTMIATVLAVKKGLGTDIIDTINTGYTSITNSGCLPLIEYVDRQLNRYIKDVLIPSNTIGEETQDSILILLRNEEVTYDDKIKIISQTKMLTSEIDALPNGLWKEIVSQNKINPSFYTVILYFKEYGRDISLTSYLSRASTYTALHWRLTEEEKNKLEVWEDLETRFAIEIITNMGISDNASAALTEKIPFSFKELDITGLSKIRVSRLIDSGVFELSTTNFGSVTKVHNDIAWKLVEKNIKTYIDHANEYTLAKQDFTNLLESAAINDGSKIQLAANVPPDYLADNRLRSLIQTILISHLGSNWPFSLKNALIVQTPDIEEKLSLLNSFAENLTIEEISQILFQFGHPFDQLASGIKKKLRLDKSNARLSILFHFLQQKGMITSFTEEQKKFIVWVKAR